MRLRLSATATLALLVAALALAGQWVAHVVSSDVLQATVHEREIDKIRTIGSSLSSLIDSQGQKAQLISRLLATNPDLRNALQLKEPARTRQLAKVLDDVFALQQVLTLEVTDENETVIYRAHDPARFGDPASGWGVAEALSGTGMLVSERLPDVVVIRAIEPLRLGTRVQGTVAAGLGLDSTFIRQLGHQVGANLVLLGQHNTNQPMLSGQVDPNAVEEAFQKKIPIYRVDAQAHLTSVYLPLKIVDDAYVMLAQLDSTNAYRLIETGNQRSAMFAVFTLIASVLLGLLALHLVLAPLRKLRLSAEKTALELTGESIHDNTRDEVTSVVKVLNALTQRLLLRHQELEQATLAAEAANVAKSQFLSSMSHEIRTPLNGVLGMAELLQSTHLNEDQTRYLNAISSAGRALHDLLSNVLDLAKIEEGQVHLERIDFDHRQITTDVANVYREVASARSLMLVTDLHADTAAWVSGDPTRLRQVLSNLLGNAIKFTERGEIRLRSAPVAAPEGDARSWWRFTVEDTGIGLTEQAQARLFGRFTQADASTTRQFGGSGLGLAICKHLVELMGGHIHVSSEVGVGSRFWFDIPFQESLTLQAVQATVAAVPIGHGVRILVAEDNAINQMVVKQLLSRMSAELTMVENGQLAFEQVKHGQFDLVFMDCQMPVMDGFEATRQIRAWELSQPQRKSLPIIALTANALASDREACLAAGMTDYTTKPVTGKALADVMARHLPAAAAPAV